MEMKKLIYLLILLFVVAAFATTAFGQKKDYKPGEKIEYKPNPSQEIWEEGVFVEPNYNGSQPIIRTKRTQYFPQGEQKATTWDAIRPLQVKPPDTAVAKAPDNGAPDKNLDETKNETGDDKKAEGNTPAAPGRAGGNGVMTREEILSYLHTPAKRS
jgi:hypothetical protein